jgi:hypothetical protein
MDWHFRGFHRVTLPVYSVQSKWMLSLWLVPGFAMRRDIYTGHVDEGTEYLTGINGLLTSPSASLLTFDFG